jgi:large conductance mechanosensitive channel
MLGYGAFLTRVLNFLIIAGAVFLLVKQVNRLFPSSKPEAPPTPEDVVLLREIRDLLKKGQ